MTMFKQLFPMLLFLVILLGAGCTKFSQRDVEPAATQDKQEASQPQVQSPAIVMEDGSYAVKAQERSIVWRAQKRVGAKHNGTVQIQEGALVVAQGQIIGGTLVADMTTIIDVDLTDEKFNTLLVNHLKSEDFFSVVTYPTATFGISEVVEIEGAEGLTHQVTGSLTIKGIEQEISFPAMLSTTEAGLQMTGSVTLDRTLWNVRFGSDKFFDNLGNELIEDAFMLTFDLLFVAGE